MAGPLKKMISYDRKKILDLFKELGEVMPLDLEKRLGYTHREAYRILDTMEMDGFVEFNGIKNITPAICYKDEVGKKRTIALGKVGMAYMLTEKGKSDNSALERDVFYIEEIIDPYSNDFRTER